MVYRLTPEQANPPSPPGAPSAAHPAGPPRRLSRRRRAARATLAVLPSLCTLANLLCGFGSIFLASRPLDAPILGQSTPLTIAAALVFAGMLFDALDGRLARMTRSTSDLGEQLDSMADMVTFGVAPAFLAVQLMGIKIPYFSEATDQVFDRVGFVVACIYVACAALRLARFNAEIDQPGESDHNSFKGLPSPAAAGTVASLVLLHQSFFAELSQGAVALNRLATERGLGYSAQAMVVIMLLVALAMVSQVRYVHLVNRYLRGRKPLNQIGKAVLVGLLLVSVFPRWALAGAFAGYALSGPLAWIWRKLRPSPAPAPATSSEPPEPKA